VRGDVTAPATAARDLWQRLWFQEKDTTPLEVLRIGLGFLLFFNYVLLPPGDVLAFYGPEGLLSPDVVPEAGRPLTLSLFGFKTQDWQVLLFHYAFCALCLGLCLGWQTRWIKWIVLAFYYTYMNRLLLIRYGVDDILGPLLFVLCLAPIGRALSLDRRRELRDFRVAHGNEARLAPFLSRRGFACQRLIQIQMVAIYFYSGAEKLRGASWWRGEAPWNAFVDNEVAFAPFVLGLLAEHFWIVNAMAFGTIVVEIGYAFLIWGRSTRPWFLAAAIFLHLNMALFLGLYYFALTMICGHLVFARRRWYAELARRVPRLP
jgi:hypothetical protein